jgi:hypothetical protein
MRGFIEKYGTAGENTRKNSSFSLGFGGAPLARMIGLMRPLQVIARDMSVDFRGRDVGMSQHRLHGAKIGPVLQQMRCEGMPKRVGRHPLLDPSGETVLSQRFPKALPRETSARAI